MEAGMKREDRKAAVAAYKERPPALGVFAVVCMATGEVWVGQARSLDTHMNRLWFALRHGSSPHRSLQQAWTLHGEAAFKFEDLERLRSDFPVMGRKDELNRRQAIWTARLEATSL
jgi:hypothetical protein